MRVRCPHCSQWPVITRDGRYVQHGYPWHTRPDGYYGPCPGSGTIPDQPTLDTAETEEEDAP